MSCLYFMVIRHVYRSNTVIPQGWLISLVVTGTHSCSMVNRLRRFMLHAGICTHIFDTVTDVIFAVKEFEKGNVGLSVVMTIFIVGPNIWGNYMCMEMYEKEQCSKLDSKGELRSGNTGTSGPNVELSTDVTVTVPDTTVTGTGVTVMVPGTTVTGTTVTGTGYLLATLWATVRRWMWPYSLVSCSRLLSARNVLYNMCCVLQVRPLIMVLELLYHNKQSVSTVTRQSSRYADVRYFENVTENIPQIAIQLLLLLQLLALERTVLDGDKVLRIVSLISKLYSVCLALSNFQFKRRLSEKTSYDFQYIVHPLQYLAGKSGLFATLNKHVMFNVQSLAHRVIYLLMISSRVIFIGMLYVLLYDVSVPGLEQYKLFRSHYTLPLVLCEVHHVITFLYGWWVYRARLWPVPLRAFSYNYVWSFGNLFFNQMPRRVSDMSNFIAMFSFNLLQIILVGALLNKQQMTFFYQSMRDDSSSVLVNTTSLPKVETITFSSLSTTLYCTAGLCVAVYFTLLDPDKAELKHGWKLVDAKLGDCELLCDYKNHVVGTAIVTNTHILTVTAVIGVGGRLPASTDSIADITAPCVTVVNSTVVNSTAVGGFLEKVEDML